MAHSRDHNREAKAAQEWAGRDYDVRWSINEKFTEIPGNDFQHAYPTKQGYINEWWEERYLPDVYCHKHEVRIGKPERGCALCIGDRLQAAFDIMQNEKPMTATEVVERRQGTYGKSPAMEAIVGIAAAKTLAVADKIRKAEETEISRLEHEIDRRDAAEAAHNLGMPLVEKITQDGVELMTLHVNKKLRDNTAKYEAALAAGPNVSNPRDELSYKQRKEMPLFEGLMKYFPDACLYVSHVSFVANEQHNPGEPMHWAREKSIGKGNEIARHLLDAGTIDGNDKLRHSGKGAWRYMELLQREIEADRARGIDMFGQPIKET